MKSINHVILQSIKIPRGLLKFVDIPGYEGIYKISNHGDVISINQKILSVGYSVILTKNKERRALSINTLMSICWLKKDINIGPEKWIEIPGYEKLYRISNYGVVKSYRTLTLLPTNGKVTLIKKRAGKTHRECISVLKIYVNCFKPYN